MKEAILKEAWERVRSAPCELTRLRATVTAWKLEARVAPTAGAKAACDRAAALVLERLR